MGDTKLGLRLLFWGAGAETGVRLVTNAWFRGERRFLSHTMHIESFRDAFEWFVPIFLQLAGLAATALMVIGAWRLAVAARGRARIYLWIATGSLAGWIVGHLPNRALALGIAQKAVLGSLWGIISSVSFILFLLGSFALLLGMMELAREAKARIPWIAGGALAALWLFDALYWMLLIRWIGYLRGDEWHLLFAGLDLAQTVLLLALIDGLANVLEPKPAPASDWRDNAGWPLAADGLRSYRTALLGRIFVPLGAVVLILMAIALRTLALAATAAIAMPFLIVLFSVWMLVGIQRFATYVPKETEARTAAGVASKLMIVAAILDAIALGVLLLIFIDRHAVENGQETSQMMSSAAQLVGVLGMFILLGALRRVGNFVGLGDASRRVRIIAIMTGLSAALLTQLPLGNENTARVLNHLEGAQALLIVLLALLMLAAAIWALVVYVGLLGRLRDAMAPAIPRSTL